MTLLSYQVFMAVVEQESFQKAAQGRGGDPLAQAGHHAAGDENIFDGHKYPSLLHGRIPSREIK